VLKGVIWSWGKLYLKGNMGFWKRRRISKIRISIYVLRIMLTII